MIKNLTQIISFCFIYVSFCPNIAHSQVYFDWSKNEDSRSIVKIGDNIYLAGSSDSCNSNSLDYSLIITDSFGNLIDRRCYGTSENDQCLSILKLLDGNLLLLGQTNSSLKNLNGLAIKVDLFGNEINRMYFGASNKNESFKSAVQLDNGNIAITGFITAAQNTNDILMLLINQNLDVIVQDQYGDTGNDVGQDITKDNDNNIYIVGDTYNQSNESYDVTLVKATINGDFLWQKNYGDELSNGSQGILYTSDNCLLLYGETEIFTFSPFDFWIQKVNVNGDSIVLKTFGGNGTDALFSATEINNNFFFTGYSNSHILNQPLDATFLQCNSNLDVMEQNNFGRDGIDIGYKIINDSQNIYITGKSPNTQNEDAFFNKIPIPLNLKISEENEATFSCINKNLTNDFIYIYPNQFSFEIEIYSSLGNLVYKNHVQNINGTKIDISYLSNGLYICRIKCSKKVSIEKIIKQ